jgi:hypothetical protein
MSVAELRSQNWYRVKHDPKHDPVYGDRLFFFESGCEYGGRDEAGTMWYRISCSYWFGDWIEANAKPEQWQAHGGRHRAIYIVREDLMMFITLKWL